MNLRPAAHGLLKTPSFTITIVLTLALGIGANSAVFSVIDAVLLKPLPYPEADRLMLLQQRNPKSADVVVAPVRLMDWQRLNTTFQGLTGYYTSDGSETSGAAGTFEAGVCRAEIFRSAGHCASVGTRSRCG